MRKYNISKPEKYVKDGQEKTFWANIGTMTEFEKQDGTISRIIEIPAISLKANVFPVEPKEVRDFDKAPSKEIEYPKEVLEAEGDINPEDIPF